MELVRYSSDSNKINRMFGFVIITSILFSIFNIIFSVSVIGILIIGFLFFVTYIVILFYVSKTRTIPSTLKGILVAYILFISINIVGLINNHDSRSFVTIFQFMVVMNILFVCSTMIWERTRVQLLYYMSLILILINIPFLFSQNTGHVKGVFNNPNELAAVLLTVSFFILLYRNFQKKKKVLPVLLFAICLYLMYVSGSRASLLALGGTYLTSILWGWITVNRFRFKSYFISVIGVILGFIFIYPQLIYWSKFQYINSISWEYTGKNLYSGRQSIWLFLTDAIKEKPWLGHGPGVLPNEITKMELSAHNLYLQIGLQVGVIGLLFFIFVLYKSWSGMWYGRNNTVVKLSASFFIGILIHQSFEVTLTQNNLAIGLFQWLVIAIGISCSYWTEKNRNAELDHIAKQRAP